MTDLGRALSVAQEVAQLGARIALDHFQRDPETQRKPDGTWVTEADWKTEAQIRLRLARAFPNHNILGEEEGLTAAGGGEAHRGAPTWVVDPIDGTNNFIAGIPIWATLIALTIEGRGVIGICNAPALGEAYAAAEGEGATLNGATIRVDPIAQLEEATVVDAGAKHFLGCEMRDFYETLCRRAARTRGFGDFWGHMLVARGSAHVMVESDVSVWDVAALEVIVRQAGGRLTHLDGTDWRERGTCLTTNGRLHAEIVNLYNNSLRRA